MKKSISDCRTFAQEIVHRFYPQILPAVDVISESNLIAQDFFQIKELAKSRQGHSIQLMSQRSSNKTNALLYGFPDPGEAVGATGLLCLMRALKEKHPFFKDVDLNWNFIPCLNFDDQPNEGKTLDKVMKTGEQEVDWLVKNPRPETTALLGVATQLQPKFIFPLHDEWHCHEEIPCYMPVSRPLEKEVCQNLCLLLESFGLKVSTEVSDPVMGSGFLNMATVSEIQNSTFFQFGQNGIVFICEVPDLVGKPGSDVIAAQLAACVFVATNVAQK